MLCCDSDIDELKPLNKNFDDPRNAMFPNAKLKVEKVEILVLNFNSSK